jgi:hypothetical protein
LDRLLCFDRRSVRFVGASQCACTSILGLSVLLSLVRFAGRAVHHDQFAVLHPQNVCLSGFLQAKEVTTGIGGGVFVNE